MTTSSAKPKIAFLLQTNYVTHLSVPVAYYVNSRGYDIVDCTSSTDLDIMNIEHADWSQYDLVIPYGSVQLIHNFLTTPLARYMEHKEDGFSTDHWMSIYGDKALNYGGQTMQAKDVMAHLAQHHCAHVRPNSVSKAFIAALFDKDSWEAHAWERNVDDDLDVFVSSPKILQREYRCWVVDGDVVDISQYLHYGVLEVEPCTDQAVFEAAQAFADIYQPATGFVLDVALTPDGYKVIELNGFHGAGWYAGNLEKILDRYVDSMVRRLNNNI